MSQVFFCENIVFCYEISNATSKRIGQHGALRGLLPRVAYATLHFTAGMPRLFGPSFDSAMMNHKTFLFFSYSAERGLLKESLVLYTQGQICGHYMFLY